MVMRSFGTRVIAAGAAAAAAVAVAIGAIDGGGGAETFHLFVARSDSSKRCDPTPTRQASKTTFADAAGSAVACSFKQAYSVAADDDVVLVKTGSYGLQGSVGGLRSVTFLGENGAKVNTGNAVGNYQMLNLTGNVTVDNIDVTGDTPLVQTFGRNNTWRNGRIEGARPRPCSPNADEPFIIQDGDALLSSPTITNTVIDNMVFAPVKGHLAGAGGCPLTPEPDAFHAEQIRVGRGVNGLVIRNSTFEPCLNGNGYNGCGSGHIFLTHQSDGDPAAHLPRNVTLRNNVFMGSQGGVLHTSTHTTASVGWRLEYNTMKNEPIINNANVTGIVMVGNLGPRPQDCTAGFTFVKNLWQGASGPGSGCGSDTVYLGDSYGLDVAAAGLDGTFVPKPGSRAINAAETPAASDVCTDPALLDSRDHAGKTRPIGAACDAGAYEVG
jgi:hypothetical protein